MPFLIIGLLLVIIGVVMKVAFKLASCAMRIFVILGIALFVLGLFILIF